MTLRALQKGQDGIAARLAEIERRLPRG